MKSPVVLYRFGRKLDKLPVIQSIITLTIRLIYSCYLPCTAKIGKNLTLGYGGLGIVIHNESEIGDNCHIDQNVTIGGKRTINGVPKIGNNVYIGTGAVILGPISIGDNCMIGANSVVITDIPNNSLVVGVPGKVRKVL